MSKQIKVRLSIGGETYYKGYKTKCIGLYVTKNPNNSLYGITHALSGLGFLIDEFFTLKLALEFANELQDINWLLSEDELSCNEQLFVRIKKLHDKLNTVI